MKEKVVFDKLVKIALILYALLIIFGVMLKSIIPSDLIANYNFLSTFTFEERLLRGLNLIEFYKIEYMLNELYKALVLDMLNLIIFIPFGILLSHLIKDRRTIKVLAISFIFSLIIELFQLITIIGAFMLNDLILNTLGGLIGVVIYKIMMKKENIKLLSGLTFVFIGLSLLVLGYLIFNFINHFDIYRNIFSIN